MKRTRGTIAARLLTALLAFSLLGQNVVTVYAETPQGEEVVIDSEKEEEETPKAEKEEEETPKAEGEDEETPGPEEEESTEPEEEEEAESEEDEENSESEEEEEETPESEEEESTDPADEEDTEVDPEETVELSATAKAFLDAWDACKALIPNGVMAIMNDEEAYAAFAEQLESADEAYNALTDEDLQLDDVKTAVAEYVALFDGSDEPAPLDAGVASVNGQEYVTLQAAIDAATDGNTVTLTTDTTENIKIKKAITLDLNGHTLTGTGNDTVIQIDAGSSSTQITVRNGKITGGNSSNGGGFRIVRVTLQLENLNICGNSAGAGAGIRILGDAHISIHKCDIYDNTASIAGGGIDLSSATGTSTCEITESKIHGNKAPNGGGLYAGASEFVTYGRTATFILKDSEIYDNTATGGSKGGGGVYLLGNGSRFEMHSGSIKNNKSCGRGGAIYSTNWRGISITGGSLENNSAAALGGAIYIQNTNLKSNPLTEEVLNITRGVSIQNNTAQRGGGICLDGGVTANIADGVQLYNNAASLMGDDLYSVSSSKVNSLNLGAVGNGWILDDDEEKITGWYHDGYNADSKKSQKRWSKLKNYEMYSPQSNDSTTLALKAAHGQTYTVTYDANGGTGTVTDSSKYAEGKDVTVLDGTNLSLADNYFIGWNEAKDGTGKSYIAGSKFQMPARNVTLYAQWLPKNAELPGDMIVGGPSDDSTVVKEAQQGTTVSLTGQIQVTKIQEQLNKIADSFGLGAMTDRVPVTVSQFQFTATLKAPTGLTLPANKDTEDAIKIDVTSNLGDFKVTSASVSGDTVTVTFGADTSTINNFGQLKSLVNSAANQNNGWISVTVPGVKIDDAAAADSHLTATGTVTGDFAATAGYTKAYTFHWEAKQDEAKRDSYTKVADIQATVKVTAATPVTVQNDPPVSKTVTGNPSTAATFEFTLTPDEDSYPLPQKNGQDSTKVTITGSGSAEFGDITFTQPGTYQYQVKETDGKVENYTYDTKVYTVVYTVTNNNGTLECARTINGSKDTQTCSFTNSYSAPSTPETPSTPSDDGGNGGGDNGGGSSTPSTPSTPNSVVQRITEFGNQIADAAEDIVEYITEFGSEGNESGQMTEEGHVSATGDDSLIMVYAAVAGASAAAAVLWFALRKRTHI